MADKKSTCKICEGEVLDGVEECDKCVNNPIRRAWFEKQKKQPLSYKICPIDGELLKVVETDKKGIPCKWICPICKQETTQPLEREHDPEHNILFRYAYFCADPGNPDKNIPPKDFKPQRCADAIKAQFFFITDRKTSILYYYDIKNHVWSPNGEAFLDVILANVLKDENRTAHYNNALYCLKCVTKQDFEFNKKLALKNGIYDPIKGTFSPFTPNERVFYSLPVEYNPEAKCPKYLKFLNDVLPEDDIKTLQEWSGYLLLPEYRYHKIAWLHGIGRNGKGVWARTMHGTLGKHNCSFIGIEEFNVKNRFVLYQLYGKLYNESSEPQTNKALQTPIIKKISGQDPIDAELKGKQQRVQFVNCAKLTIIGNRYPKVNDKTNAFWDRSDIIIHFPKIFDEKEQVANLEKTWLEDKEEPSGILNWMIEGKDRLLKNGRFTKSKTQQESILEFKRLSDSISAWLHECIIFDKCLWITRSEAYEDYKDYCDAIGAEVESNRTFTQTLKHTPKIKDTKKKVRGKSGTRVWIGIGLKPEDKRDYSSDNEENDESGADKADRALSTYCPELSKKESDKEQQPNSAPSASSALKNGIITEDNVDSAVFDGKKTLILVDKKVEVESEEFVAQVERTNQVISCHDKCGLVAKWYMVIEDPEHGKLEYYFCNNCFQKAKNNLENNNYKVRFKEASDG